MFVFSMGVCVCVCVCVFVVVIWDPWHVDYTLNPTCLGPEAPNLKWLQILDLVDFNLAGLPVRSRRAVLPDFSYLELRLQLGSSTRSTNLGPARQVARGGAECKTNPWSFHVGRSAACGKAT